MDIENLLKKQRKYFEKHQTKDVNYRIKKLKELRLAIIKNEDEICNALKKDLGKSKTESYMTEIGMALDDLRCMLKNVRKWSKKKNHLTPLAQFPSTSYEIAEAYGLTLIISPWNYPFLLSIQPLIGAIGAGNCAIIKPSEYSPNTSKVIKKLIEEVFDEEYVAVVLGDKEICQELLNQRFDYIFYTGSTRVGKIVMESAAKNLTPVTLELGGKSPCIIEDNADINLAAKRIIFGKLLNCGQTCVAPDYVLVQEDVKESFITYCKEYIEEFLLNKWNDNNEYPKIINEKQFNRMVNLIDKKSVVYGGNSNKETLKIEPTLLDIKEDNEKCMEEEIFGPILPIIGYEKINDAIKYVASKEKPLALYLFTSSKKTEKRVLNELSFGGGCINDTIIHLASTKLGFGGIGNSGIGAYHGKKSFDTFSHYKSILKKSTLLDLPMRYHPYTKINDMLIRIFMR